MDAEERPFLVAAGEFVFASSRRARQTRALRGRQGRAVLLRPLRTQVQRPPFACAEFVSAQSERPAPRTLRGPNRRRLHLQVLRAHLQGHPLNGVEFVPEESDTRREARACKVIANPLSNSQHSLVGVSEYV